MSADTLRRAAALMRERAEAATKGPWQHTCLGSEGCLTSRAHDTIRERGQSRVARFGSKDWKADHADADHVTGMAPPVALAIADWLDAAVATAEGYEAEGAFIHPDSCALKVARVYLGEVAA